MTPRIIPCLLLVGERFVKTTRFSDPVYVGDPVNVLSIFNSFEVDEIVLLDITATLEGRSPQLDLIAHLATECLIPLSYGGGVTTTDDASRILEAGLEKVVLGTVLAENPDLATDIADRHGSQAVMASLDVRREEDRHAVFVRSGRDRIADDAATQARRLQDLGVGEILLQSIDRDGTMEGYDLDVISAVSAAVTIPVVACGGAGKRAQLRDAITAGASAAAAGSLFVFQGRQRGVLINFPSRAQLTTMFHEGPT